MINKFIILLLCTCTFCSCENLKTKQNDLLTGKWEGTYDYIYKQKDIYEGQFMSGATYFEPLIIFETPDVLIMHSWYWDEFPEERETL
jgi:hypothetical protein